MKNFVSQRCHEKCGIYWICDRRQKNQQSWDRAARAAAQEHSSYLTGLGVPCVSGKRAECISGAELEPCGCGPPKSMQAQVPSLAPHMHTGEAKGGNSERPCPPAAPWLPQVQDPVPWAATFFSVFTVSINGKKRAEQCSLIFTF